MGMGPIYRTSGPENLNAVMWKHRRASGTCKINCKDSEKIYKTLVLSTECENSQFKDHVVKAIAAVCFQQADYVRMLQAQAYTSLTLQIYANRSNT